MTYTITRNDTMYGIAQRFGVSLKDLLAFNNLTTNSVIFPGMVIRIPPSRPITPVPPIGKIPPQNRVYIVRRGDTVWSIARQFGVSVQNLMFTNGLTFPLIFPGQRLIIPTTSISIF